MNLLIKDMNDDLINLTGHFAIYIPEVDHEMDFVKVFYSENEYFTITTSGFGDTVKLQYQIFTQIVYKAISSGMRAIDLSEELKGYI